MWRKVDDNLKPTKLTQGTMAGIGKILLSSLVSLFAARIKPAGHATVDWDLDKGRRITYE